MNYDQIRKELKTGDVILFSGKGGISDGIKLFTFSRWSHVGMVYRVDEGDIVFCWESTSLGNVADAETGKLTNGVQLVVFSERLEKCLAGGYEIAVRQLNQALTGEMIRKLHDFRNEVSGRKYEQNKLQLIKSAWDGWLGENSEDLSSLFCSELLAEAFQRMGLLPETEPSNEYTPKDFSSEESLKLMNGYSMGNEKWIATV